MSREKIGSRRDGREVTAKLRQWVNLVVVAEVTAIAAANNRLQIFTRAAVVQGKPLREHALLRSLPAVGAVALGVGVGLLRAEALEEYDTEPGAEKAAGDKTGTENVVSVGHRLDTTAHKGKCKNRQEDKNLHFYSSSSMERYYILLYNIYTIITIPYREVTF